MRVLPKSIEDLVESISSLPGIGPKSASRIAFFLLKAPVEMSENLAESIIRSRKELRICSNCFNYSEGELCDICSNEKREPHRILVIEDALDLVAIEKTGEYLGHYHVLGGLLSPMNGVGPDEIRIEELLRRLMKLDAKKIELIIGLNPNMEGESTALYIQKEISDRLKSKQILVTKLARGLSSGADIDYLDEYTLRKALEGRNTF